MVDLTRGVRVTGDIKLTRFWDVLKMKEILQAHQLNPGSNWFNQTKSLGLAFGDPNAKLATKKSRGGDFTIEINRFRDDIPEEEQPEQSNAIPSFALLLEDLSQSNILVSYELFAEHDGECTMLNEQITHFTEVERKFLVRPEKFDKSILKDAKDKYRLFYAHLSETERIRVMAPVFCSTLRELAEAPVECLEFWRETKVDVAAYIKHRVSRRITRDEALQELYRLDIPTMTKERYEVSINGDVWCFDVLLPRTKPVFAEFELEGRDSFTDVLNVAKPDWVGQDITLQSSWSATKIAEVFGPIPR